MTAAQFKLTWLADVLRAAGVPVIEEDGWKSRGRGEMGAVKGVVLHHTAGPAQGNAPSLPLVRDGRPDLAGPLSQLFLARNGTWHVLASGRCNHAGNGNWHGVTAGNTQMVGIEAENMGTGKDPWPAVQMQSYEAGVAAILMYLNADSVMACGHKEYCLPKGRKIDPSFDMTEFREDVEAIMTKSLPASRVPTPTLPHRAMLKKGDRGESVKLLQKSLMFSDKDADSNFGPKTEAAVIAFQKSKGLTVDGYVGPATWQALGLQ